MEEFIKTLSWVQDPSRPTNEKEERKKKRGEREMARKKGKKALSGDEEQKAPITFPKESINGGEKTGGYILTRSPIRLPCTCTVPSRKGRYPQTDALLSENREREWEREKKI